MENVTRDVISDLWPLYTAGEASADSRALVETFLRRDPAFAETLHHAVQGPISGGAAPPLTPDHELKTLARLKKRLFGPIIIMQLAILFSCFAFGVLISDTSFDVSPRRFIATAAIAACFWIAFFVRLLQYRRSVLVIRS